VDSQPLTGAVGGSQNNQADEAGHRTAGSHAF
jgi:hypothetical protein